MLNKYAIYGVLVVAVAVAGYTAVNIYTNKVEELENTKAAVSALSVQLEAQNTEFARIEERIKSVELQRKAHETSVMNLNNRVEQQKRALAGLKQREKTVMAKPGLVEIKINKAYTAQQKAYMCLTGDTTACEKP
jgi:septal ring factor EnvC (AmiA/AmiB activator)